MGTLHSGFERQLADVTFDQAVGKVTAALKTDGFGVLTEVDVRSTLKGKFGVDFWRDRIPGACNCNLAHWALTTKAQVGLLPSRHRESTVTASIQHHGYLVLLSPSSVTDQ
jgi:hypothetical protein